MNVADMLIDDEPRSVWDETQRCFPHKFDYDTSYEELRQKYEMNESETRTTIGILTTKRGQLTERLESIQKELILIEAELTQNRKEIDEIKSTN